MKKLLSTDPNFQQEMQSCLQQIDKMPGFRAKVFNQLGQMATNYNEQKGELCVLAGYETRK